MKIREKFFWSYPAIFLMILLMCIGASPGSTEGGIKTTTFAMALKSVWNNIRGEKNICKRTIGRAINQIHHDVLKQTGIDEIVLLLENAAKHVSSMLQLKNTLKLTEINNDFFIAEVNIPSKYIGHCLDAKISGTI